LAALVACVLLDHLFFGEKSVRGPRGMPFCKQNVF
jgi:hypothetical protein